MNPFFNMYIWISAQLTQHFENYTSVHLKYGILIFLIKNFDNTQLLSDIKVNGIAQAQQTRSET